MNIGKILATLALTCVLAGGSAAVAQQPPAQADQAQTPAKAAPADYLVQPGDTLTFAYHFGIHDPATPYKVESGDKLFLFFSLQPRAEPPLPQRRG